jgi:hypothetical protein
MSASVQKKIRNLCSAGVSILALLVALVGTAWAEQRAPQRRERVPVQERVQHDRGPAQPPPRHETAFKPVPGTKLEIRAVQYDGSTNGTLTVQVRNKDKTVQKFAASGLYFIPEGDPDKAPQRLGAVGPMQLAKGPAQERTELAIAAGETVELNLDVFCIDSHRSSPTPQHKFNIGATRMPKELSATIENRATKSVEEAKSSGHAKPRAAAKSRIQSEVWKSRDSKWIKLDGEGMQEATK